MKSSCDSHLVHFYNEDQHLISALAEFVRIGLNKKEGVVVIASKTHAAELKKNLPPHDSEQIIYIDADIALKLIMPEGSLNKVKFSYFANNIIKQMYPKYAKLRIYDDLVNVLCSFGLLEMAEEIETFWNDNLEKYTHITLLCGYSRANLSEKDIKTLASKHSHVTSRADFVFTDMSLVNKISSLEIQLVEKDLNKLDQKRLENEIRVMKYQATHSMKLSLLGEISAGLAHELINPLTIIKSYTSVINAMIVDENFETKEMVLKQISGINATVNRMNDLMKNVLQLSANNLTPEHGEYSVSEALASSVEMMKSHLKSRNIRINYKASQEELRSFGNSGQMVQVFLNLFANARDAILEAHGAKGGTIFIEETFSDKGNVKIVISDNGIGMEKSVMEKMFNPFFTTKPYGEGTGLGLSLTQKIVKEFKGQITCDSKLHEGTKFVIFLPLKAAEREKNRA